MCCFVNKIALSSHTDGGQDVISCAHHFPNASFTKFVQDPSSARFQFIFKYNETKEIQARFSFFSLHLLDFDPVQPFEVLGGTGDYSKSSMSVVREKFLVITGN